MPENRVQITPEDVKNIKRRLDEEQKDGVGLEIVCNFGSGCRKALDDLKSDIDRLSSSIRPARPEIIEALSEALTRDLAIEKRQEEQLPGKRL